MKKIREDTWNKTEHVEKIRQNRRDRVVKNEPKKERRSADNEHTIKGLLELETPGHFFLLSLWDMKLK